MQTELGLIAVLLHLAVRLLLLAAFFCFLIAMKDMTANNRRWLIDLSTACLTTAVLNQSLLAVYICIREAATLRAAAAGALRLFAIMFIDPLWPLVIVVIIVFFIKRQREGRSLIIEKDERHLIAQRHISWLCGAFFTGLVEVLALYTRDEIYTPCAYAYMLILLLWITLGIISWIRILLWRRKQTGCEGPSLSSPNSSDFL